MSEILKDCYVCFESESVKHISALRSKRDTKSVKSGFSVIEAEAKAEAKAEAEAKRIIENARSEAEEIKRRTLEEAKASIAATKEAGYKTGYNEAFQQIQCENNKALNEIKSVIDRLDDEKDRLLCENKKDIIELSFKIAEKVINQKLTTDRESYLKIYEMAVKDLSAQKWVKLSVSNQNLELVTKNSENLLSMVSGAERLEIVVLEGAPEGECIVETSDRIVDAGVGTQLEQLRAAVLKA